MTLLLEEALCLALAYLILIGLPRSSILHLFRCRIIYHIKDPIVLQNISELSIPVIKIGTHKLVIVQQ